MYFCYPDDPGSAGKGNFSMPDLDPNMMFLKHFDNWLFLNQVLKVDPSLINRFQATKELKMCEKKLDWWANRHGFKFTLVESEMKSKKKLWNLDTEYVREGMRA